MVMRDLGNDTSVEPASDGQHIGNVTPDWDGFGSPNGGFLAAMSLRVAATVAHIPAPRTVQCQFLHRAEHGEISFTSGVLGRSRRSDIVQVIASQEGRQVLATMVRTMQPSESNATHAFARPPDVPDADILRPTEDLLPLELVHVAPLTRRFEVRPVTWERSWPPSKGRNSRSVAWARFRPAPVFEDPFISVGRYLILLDSYGWAAMERGTGAEGLIARTTDLSVTVEDPGHEEDWLLCDVRVPLIHDGVISAIGSIWSRDGALLATGSINMAYSR